MIKYGLIAGGLVLLGLVILWGFEQAGGPAEVDGDRDREQIEASRKAEAALGAGGASRGDDAFRVRSSQPTDRPRLGGGSAPSIGDSGRGDGDEEAARPNPLIDEAGLAEQGRVGDYFRGSVIPRLRSCYSNLSPGKVEFRYRFAPTAAFRWEIAPADVELHDSTLPEEEDEVALRCMREAVADTGFAMLPDETDEEGYMIYWTWHTPSAPSEAR